MSNTFNYRGGAGRLLICGGVLASLLSSGCATKKLGPDFVAFSESYAENLNWQMLVNLARLDQGHPAYFMAIGEIRMAHNEVAGLNAGGNTSRNRFTDGVVRTVSRSVGGVTGASYSASSTPNFVFIPINSEEASRQLLAPISIEVFNTLYQQGWPVDHLLRVLVERIELELPAADGGAVMRVVLTNSPTRAESPASFSRFLRACELVRDLQKRGGLQLSLSGQDGGGYKFTVNQRIFDTVLADYTKDARYGGDRSLENFRVLFGAPLEVGSGETISPAPGATRPPRSTVVLRSFRNVLDAVAKEQRAYDALAGRDDAFLAALPERQRRPVLRTDWAGIDTTLVSPVASAVYQGRHYVVADPIGDPADADARWNRDVFRLLVDLSSQVTVDITKFQRQSLELTR